MRISDWSSDVCSSDLACLVAARGAIDEITCSTIHGFCQRLIKPYPVEADIDPGASVMDRDQADLAFADVVDAWLREALSGDVVGLLAEMGLRAPTQTVDKLGRAWGRERVCRYV